MYFLQEDGPVQLFSSSGLLLVSPPLSDELLPFSFDPESFAFDT